MGNIRPDISLRYNNIPHFKKDAEGFIREEIQNILSGKIYEYEKCSSSLSERLGIITHYLSDFFCFAHSKYFTGGIIEHYLYEMQLSHYCISNSKEINQSGYDNNIVINQNSSSIVSHIDELHKKYLNSSCNKACPRDDMDFALNACISVCSSIIALCMTRKDSYISSEQEVLV
jgi:hypothetical protein